MAARRELLRSLKLPDHDAQTLRGMRFLLHGAPEGFDRNDQLWTGRGKASAAWRKLWEAVNAQEFRWTVIDPSLAELGDARRSGRIESARHRAGPRRQARRRTRRARRPGPGRSRIRRDIGYAHWEEETWKSLPAHLTATRGARSNRRNDVSRQAAGVTLPPELLSGATIVEQSAKPEVRDFNRDGFQRSIYAQRSFSRSRRRSPKRGASRFSIGSPKGERAGGHGLRAWTRRPGSGCARAPPELRTSSSCLREAEAEMTDLAEISKCYATPSMLAEKLRDNQALDLLRDRAGNLSGLYSMLRHEAGRHSGTSRSYRSPCVQRRDDPVLSG